MNMTVKGKSIAVLILLLIANIAIWMLALLAFHRFALLLGTATLAYMFGLIGVIIILLFIASWIASALAFQVMGYGKLERPAEIASSA
jgi:high-affinity nickel permease